MPPILPMAAPTPFTAAPNPFNAPEDTFNAAEPTALNAALPTVANGAKRPARREMAPPSVPFNPAPTVFAAEASGANGLLPPNSLEMISGNPWNGSDRMEPRPDAFDFTPSTILPNAPVTFDTASLMPVVSIISANAPLNSDALPFTFDAMAVKPDSTSAFSTSIFVLNELEILLASALKSSPTKLQAFVKSCPMFVRPDFRLPNAIIAWSDACTAEPTSGRNTFGMFSPVRSLSSRPTCVSLSR